MKFIRIFLYLFVLICTSQTAWGADCASIKSYISKGMTTITKAIQAAVKSSKISLDSVINQSFLSMKSVNNINTGILIKALQSLQDSNINQSKLIQKQKETIYQYNTLTSPSAQPSTLCGTTVRGAGVQVTHQIQKKTEKDMRKKQIAYSNTLQKPVKYLDRITSQEHPSLEEMTETFMSSNTTLDKKSLAIAQETIKTISDPFPAPMLADSVKKNPNTHGYEAARRSHQVRKSYAQAILTKHLNFHAPIYPQEITDWALKRWKQANPSATIETIPGLIDGKMSQSGIFELESQLRFGNPNFAAQVASSNSAGLLREYVQMQAIELEIALKNNQFLDELLLVLAQQYLSKIDGLTDKTVNELYVQTIGSQQ